MQKLTKEQAIIISGYTGYLACTFDILHEDIEKRLGHSVFTHALASETLQKKITELYKEDFLKITY